MFLDLFPEENLRAVSTPPEPKSEPREQSEPHVFSVSEITRSVRALIENELGQVWVQGEICNHRRQASGHQYFGLKDERAVLGCVLFQRAVPRCRVALADGMLVQVRGEMTVYEARGQYQLNVNLVQPAGVGLLQAKFETLKRKLEAEGLFSSERKRQLPKFPAIIGIVTSPTGAAISDMLNIVQRRAPWVRVVINPVRVQGEGACAEIAVAIAEFNHFQCDGASFVDVIVVCRGGGSAEDLWAFNEEVVARAIFASAIPVVSAVGHEIDFTIADFVADLRAPTPSAAAELIVPDAAELVRFFSQHANRLRRELVNCVARWRARISAVLRASPFRAPQRKLAECAQRLDQADDALRNGAILAIAARKQRLAELTTAIESTCPGYAVKMQWQKIESLQQRLAHLGQQRIASSRSRCVRAEAMLRTLSPQNVLARGYTISTTDSGTVITDPAQVQPGASMTTITAKGKIRSVVN